MSTTLHHPPRPAGWEKQTYPMPSFPLLSVADPDLSARWYQEMLGFADVVLLRSPAGHVVFAHLRWSIFADVLLTKRVGNESQQGSGCVLCFGASDVDTIAERARAAGERQISGPIISSWNTRDVDVIDPDGYRLRFTAPLPHLLQEHAPSFQDVIDGLSLRT